MQVPERVSVPNVDAPKHVRQDTKHICFGGPNDIQFFDRRVDRGSRWPSSTSPTRACGPGGDACSTAWIRKL